MEDRLEGHEAGGREMGWEVFEGVQVKTLNQRWRRRGWVKAILELKSADLGV